MLALHNFAQLCQKTQAEHVTELCEHSLAGVGHAKQACCGSGNTVVQCQGALKT